MINKMQRSTIFFIAFNAVRVSGGFSAHHQELKIQNCTHSFRYVLSLLAATAIVSEFSLTIAVAASKLKTYRMLCVHFLILSS
jgi:hypothetical protein